MYTGHVDNITRYIVQGWAANKTDPDGKVEVIVSVNDTPVRRLSADMPRPDLAGRGDLGNGAHGFRVYLPNRLSTSKEQTVQVRFAANGELLPNGSRAFQALDTASIEARLQSSAPASLRPLLVTHIARSGSTFLMNLLSRHPNILVPRSYPFEVKPATYYARAARLLSEPGDHDASSSPTEFMRDGYWLGSNPFNHVQFDEVFTDQQLRTHFYEVAAPAAICAAMRGLSLQYYQHLALDQGRAGATFFAEKCEAQGDTRKSFQALYPDAYEIILIRDPRDVFCSSLSYFKRSELEPLVENISNACKFIMAASPHGQMPRAFVKYERLMSETSAAMDEIWTGIGLQPPDQADPAARDEDQLFKVHATTASPAQSIGRWKKDLTSEQQQLCNAAFRPFLEQFDYES